MSSNLAVVFAEEDNHLKPHDDPMLLSRHQLFSKSNLANDPDFLIKLADEMEEDEELAQFIYDCFHEGKLAFLFHDGQRLIYDMLKKDEQEFLIFCARQLGKSFFILVFAIMHCSALRKGRKPLVRIFCQTQKQVTDIVQDNMQLIEMIAPEGFIKRTKSENRWKVGLGEIRVGMLSRAHADGKRGGNATLIITEEGSFSPSDDFKSAVQNVLAPQLLRSEGAMVHVTTPSKEVLHFIHTVILPKCQLAGTYINLTVFHNPQLKDSQILKAFDLIFDGDFEQWNREYLALIVRSKNLTVVPEWRPSRIVVPHDSIVLPPFAHWLTSIDFGGVKDKHGILLCYYDFKRAKLVFYDEILLPINTSTSAIAKQTREIEAQARWLKDEQRVSDSPGQVTVDLNGDHNFYVFTPTKGPGSFEAGVNQFRLNMQNEAIEISDRCKMLILTIEHGMFNKKRTDFERTELLGHLDLLASAIQADRHINRNNPYPANYPYHGQRREDVAIVPEENYTETQRSLTSAFS